MCFNEAGNFSSSKPLKAYKILKTQQNLWWSPDWKKHSPPFTGVALTKKEWLQAKKDPYSKTAPILLNSRDIVGFSCFPTMSRARKWMSIMNLSTLNYGVFEVEIQGLIRVGFEKQEVLKYLYGPEYYDSLSTTILQGLSSASTTQYEKTDVLYIAWTGEQIRLVSDREEKRQ